MSTHATRKIVGLLFISVGFVYLLVVSLPIAGHEQTLLQIALAQPWAAIQFSIGTLVGIYIGITISRIPTTWNLTSRQERRRLIIAGIYLVVLCVLSINSGRATVEPLMRGSGPQVLLHLLPFTHACVSTSCVSSGLALLYKRAA